MSDSSPGLLGRLRALGLGSRRLKRGWNRARLIEALKTLGYVAPLTLLIWLWAQDQQIDVDSLQSVPIGISHTDAGRVVTVRGAATGEPLIQIPGGIRANLAFRGPRIGLSSVRSALAENSIASVLEIRLSRQVGDSTVLLAEQLNQLPLLRNAGVTVREATPASIMVGIEEREQIEVRIVPDNVGPEDLAGPVQFEPETIVLSGPRSALRAFQGTDPSPVLKAALPDTPPGEQDVTWSVPIPDETGTIRPERVDVRARFTRRERREERLTLPFPVPVYTTIPAALTVEPEGLQPVVSGVRVRGPADLIARLQTSDADDPLRAQIRAVVALTREDELRAGEQTTITRDVRLELPDGLLPDGEPLRVTFSLRRRADAL